MTQLNIDFAKAEKLTKDEEEWRARLDRAVETEQFGMRKLFNCIVARCKPDSKRRDAEWYAAKGLEVSITVADLKALWIRDGADRMTSPTIDRRESHLGYSYDNCHFIEHADNLRKMIPTRRKRRWHKKPVELPIESLRLPAQEVA